MNEITKKTMSSIEIAELAGKRHTHVMRAIRNMEPAWELVSQSKFGLASYKDAQGKDRPCYELTKTECLYIATKFNDEARARLVLRWEELEKNSTPALAGQAVGASILLSKALEERERAVMAEHALKDIGDEIMTMICSTTKYKRNWHMSRIIHKIESAYSQFGLESPIPDFIS